MSVSGDSYDYGTPAIFPARIFLSLSSWNATSYLHTNRAHGLWGIHKLLLRVTMQVMAISTVVSAPSFVRSSQTRCLVNCSGHVRLPVLAGGEARAHGAGSFNLRCNLEGRLLDQSPGQSPSCLCSSTSLELDASPGRPGLR